MYINSLNTHCNVYTPSMRFKKTQNKHWDTRSFEPRATPEELLKLHTLHDRYSSYISRPRVCDCLAEWLRRWTGNPLEPYHAGSNPSRNLFFFFFSSSTCVVCGPWFWSWFAHARWAKMRDRLYTLSKNNYIVNKSVEVCRHACRDEIYQLSRHNVYVFLKSRN